MFDNIAKKIRRKHIGFELNDKRFRAFEGKKGIYLDEDTENVYSKFLKIEKVLIQKSIGRIMSF